MRKEPNTRIEAHPNCQLREEDLRNAYSVYSEVACIDRTYERARIDFPRVLDGLKTRHYELRIGSRFSANTKLVIEDKTESGTGDRFINFRYDPNDLWNTEEGQSREEEFDRKIREIFLV